MKTLLATVATIVLSVSLGLAQTPGQPNQPRGNTSPAQDGSGSYATDDPISRTTGDSDSSWGWVGLLGLAGLAGLWHRKERREYHSETAERLQSRGAM
jgi:MYXO-CTERM domain-containing protein